MHALSAKPWLLCALFLGALSAPLSLFSQIRPLAQEFVVVGEAADAKTMALYSPSIVRLSSGRLVASYEQTFTKETEMKPVTLILTSDNGGKTWLLRAATKIFQGRLFVAGAAVYLLGHSGDLRITRSDDEGITWSNASTLTAGQQWHQTAANVWRARGNIYLVMERHTTNKIVGWRVGELAPVLMRAPESANLLLPTSWTFASELSFGEALPGLEQNHPELDMFGIPFYAENYPNRAVVEGSRATMAPMGWLETNVVQIVDPNHYWFDPALRTFHLISRAHTGGTGYGTLAKVVENADGSMTTSLERAPSGKTMLYFPLPGGAMRFHILYDEKTKLYWMVGSQPTDSMSRPETLSRDRYGLPNNERHRMVLHFSRNLIDWCFAGLVATGDSPKESRHYASMDFDGDDLVILSRSADMRARSAHESNLITFHRVKNFRRLVY